MRRVFLATLPAVAVALALTLAAPASASPSVRFGIQDDAWLLYGEGPVEQRVAELDALGVRVVRFTLRWDQVAPTKPAHPLDPSDPAYVWGPYDAVLRGLHAHGIAALVTLWGAPRWANGGHAPSWLPRSGFGSFAYAAARRYPWVRMWTVWNEPNTRVFAHPVSPSLYVRQLLNPAYAQLHRASRANLVAGGVTSPRKTPSGMSPSVFMAGMRAAHARLDAYAQNPYPGSPRETPLYDPCSWCRTLTMARLGTIRADVSRLFGVRTPLWLTEYGYQTNPPDRLLGVAPALQARYEAEAALKVWQQPGVTVLIHFLVRDEPTLGGWQSGLLTVSGAQKPAYRSFALPLAEIARRGARVELWGQVRPGSGRRRYAIQRFTGRGWRTVGGVRHTGAGGTFRATVTAPRGAKLRLSSSEVDFDSPLLVVS